MIQMLSAVEKYVQLNDVNPDGVASVVAAAIVCLQHICAVQSCDLVWSVGAYDFVGEL